MGNYLFTTSALIELLEQDAAQDSSSHDFGRDIIPPLIGRQPVAYDFRQNHIFGEIEGERPYWRDVGTLDAYYEANIDLRDVTPQLNLYNRHWPIQAGASISPPAKFIFNDWNRQGRRSNPWCRRCIVSGGIVIDSVLGRNVFVHSFSRVEWSIIMDNCHIHRYARVRRAIIIDKNVEVPESETIGWDIEHDRRRFTVTDAGVVVIPKDYVFPRT